MKPLHPGRAIEDACFPLGLELAEAAALLGVLRKDLQDVVFGRSGVTPELALRLETVIGGTVEGWLRMQAEFDAYAIRQEAGRITEGLAWFVPGPEHGAPDTAFVRSQGPAHIRR